MKTRACATALLLSFSFSVLPVGPALGQDKDAVTEMARRRFQEGVKFFDAKQFEEARAAFLQAYALKHHPAVLLNLAQSELRSNHPVDAARHFSQFMREGTQATPSQRTEAEKGLATARNKIGRIQISVNATGAEVIVDNESVGTAPLPEAVDVAPGTHSVEAKMGGRTATSSVTVTAGKVATTSLSLEGGGTATTEPGPFPPASPAGSTKPATPEAEPPKDPSADSSALANADSGISVSTGGRQPFFKWLFTTPTGLTGFGATVLGLGTFGIAGISSMRAQDNADFVQRKIIEEGKTAAPGRENLCGDPVPAKFVNACNILRDNLDKRDTDRTIAGIGLAVGVVGVGVTVVGYMLSSKKGPEAAASRTALTPYYGPHQAGLVASGSF
jgi:PEGA domain